MKSQWTVKENEKSDSKINKVLPRNKVRKQTHDFFSDRLARGLVTPH
jgi:hypothetical protein